MYQTENNKLILDYFENHKEESFTAKQICNYFKNKMNRATIYRQLASLVEVRRIRKIYLTESDSYEYQYRMQHCDSHLHLMCSNCGKIIHLECSQSNIFLNHILEKHHFNVNQERSVIFGLCEECQHA